MVRLGGGHVRDIAVCRLQPLQPGGGGEEERPDEEDEANDRAVSEPRR